MQKRANVELSLVPRFQLAQHDRELVHFVKCTNGGLCNKQLLSSLAKLQDSHRFVFTIVIKCIFPVAICQQVRVAFIENMHENKNAKLVKKTTDNVRRCAPIVNKQRAVSGKNHNHDLQYTALKTRWHHTVEYLPYFMISQNSCHKDFTGVSKCLRNQ
jgi:hypothetical protein